MAKKTDEEKTEMINGNVALPEELRSAEKSIEIVAASVKDKICHFKYRYKKGVEKGNTQTSDSIYVVKDSLLAAFSKFNVHMACLDDMFKNSGLEVTDIDMLHGHEHTGLFECSGFEIIGDEDSESVVLIGTKYVSTGGGSRTKLKLAKVSIDNLSSYKWYNELKTAADDARKEVELYKNGNYVIPEDDEEEIAKNKKKQTKIKFVKEVDSTGAEIEEPATGDDTFDNEFGEARL